MGTRLLRDVDVALGRCGTPCTIVIYSISSPSDQNLPHTQNTVGATPLERDCREDVCGSCNYSIVSNRSMAKAMPSCTGAVNELLP